MNETRDPAAVRFGPFLYEPLNGRLLRAGAELGVPPRALAILGCLIERPGLVVTKQALLDRVWKDAFVTDTSLSEAVSVLRQALGDDAQEPSYVQTVPRRGYRFIADVAPAAPTTTVPAEIAAPARVAAPEASPPLWTPWFPWLVCFVCGLAFGMLVIALPRHPAAGEAAVARFTLPLPAGYVLAAVPASLAVSADGRLIVAVLEDASGRRLAFARPLDAPAFQALPGSDGARTLFVSADGTRVGIVAGDRVRELAMPSGSWAQVTTASLVRGATWLDDGSLLLASGADGALRKMPARGGDAVIVARPRRERGEDVLEAPVRVGRTGLVFSATRPGREPALYAWPASASSPRLIGQGASPQWIEPSHLLFRSGDRMHAAVLLPPDWTVLRTALLPTLGRVNSDDAIAATGGTLVRTPPCRTCDAVVLRTETGDAQTIPVPGTGVDAWRLTADGTQVLVIARHGEDRHVWRIAVADGTRTLLERGPACAIASDVTGMSVVLASQQEGRWTIRAPDSSRPLATASVPLVPTAVTNDGVVWFHREGAAGSLDVWTVGPDAAAHAVVATPHTEWDAQPSPDGRQVAFVSDARGEPEIVVRDVASGEALATWPGAEVRWTADGAALLVREGRRWQAVAWDPTRHRLVPSGMPPQLPLPAAATPATELDVVLQWARDVRQQVPVAPRPLPVVR